MGYLSFIFASLMAAPALAAPAQAGSMLMLCLGKEEKTLHTQKLTGPTYDLNQRLIGELILINRIDAPTAILKKVCRSKSSASLELLEEMLLNPKGWAKLPSDIKGVEASIAQELVKDVNLGIPEVLLAFLGQLQAAAPDAQCLNKNIPGLNTLNEEVKWLQEEIDLIKIAGRKSRLKKIFAGIKQAPSYFEKCRQETAQANSKSKNKAKETGKPSSQ